MRFFELIHPDIKGHLIEEEKNLTIFKDGGEFEYFQAHPSWHVGAFSSPTRPPLTMKDQVWGAKLLLQPFVWVATASVLGAGI